MMTLLTFFIIIVLLFCISAFFYLRRARLQGPSDLQYLNKAHTSIAKGYAALFILFAHIGQYTGVNGIELPGAIGVSIFIILSGYGLCISVKNGGGVRHFWKKRICRIYLPYILSQSIYYIVKRINVSFISLLLDFTLINPLHQFGWYLRYIMICYIIFYLISLIFKSDKLKIIALGLFFAAWFVLKSTLLIDETYFLQPRQMLAFLTGFVLAMKKDLIQQKLKWYYDFLLMIFGLALYVFLHTAIGESLPIIIYNFISLFTCVVFAFAFIDFIWRFKLLLNNKFIHYIAYVSFELYVIQGYTLEILSWQYIWFINLLIFLAITAICSVILFYVSKIFVKVENYLIKLVDNEKR